MEINKSQTQDVKIELSEQDLDGVAGGCGGGGYGGHSGHGHYGHSGHGHNAPYKPDSGHHKTSHGCKPKPAYYGKSCGSKWW